MENNNILISIILPVYNSELYLRECLDSIFNQSLNISNFELIAIIDLFTDKSLSILEEYQKKYSNLVILKESERGVAIKRIDGVKLAKGQYICFIDSDDYYHKDFLKIMLSEIKKGYQIVNCAFFNNRDSKIKKDLFRLNKSMDSYKGVKYLFKDSYIRSFFWNKIFDKKLFELPNLVYPKDRYSLFEDSITIFDLFTKAKKIKSISIPLYYYRDNKNSSIKKINPLRFKYHLYAFVIMRYLCDILDDKKYLKIFHKTLYRDKLSLLYDLFCIRKVLNGSIHLEIKKYNKEFKILKSKKKININELSWKKYILDSLHE